MLILALRTHFSTNLPKWSTNVINTIMWRGLYWFVIAVLGFSWRCITLSMILSTFSRTFFLACFYKCFTCMHGHTVHNIGCMMFYWWQVHMNAVLLTKYLRLIIQSMQICGFVKRSHIHVCYFPSNFSYTEFTGDNPNHYSDRRAQCGKYFIFLIYIFII